VAPWAELGDDRRMSAGVLYLVATPIGNLEDVTARAIRVLREVDLVAAEDTRRTGRLLQHLGFRRPLRSYYDAVERTRAPALVDELLGGRNVALVSDAGTPGIADPGYRLVASAVAAGIRVVPIPGPSAITAFLPASGLPTDRFTFEGFLPKRAAERRRRLEMLRGDERTLVFYEAGRRLPATLADMAGAFGARRAAIGRELTKLHEEIIRDDLVTLATRASTPMGTSTLVTKGEVVIGVAGVAASSDGASALSSGGREPATEHDDELAAEIKRRHDSGESVRDLAAALARERGIGRGTLYRMALIVLGMRAPDGAARSR
jgi:16S rRNA (cytidine1402-2'-O)-methyltransferase